jgi:dephospho-CoA kinase
MSAVLITGCSGAGKTTIAPVLARRDLAAINADDDPLLARSVDTAGNVVEEPAARRCGQRAGTGRSVHPDVPAGNRRAHHAGAN